MLRKLCEIHTDLTEIEIDRLEEIASNLQYITDLNNAHSFIDCLTRNCQEAIVVAHVQPSKAPLVYAENATGKKAMQKNEPAIFQAFNLGLAVHDLKGITQENITVKQSVVPINSLDGHIIGVLIQEIDVSSSVIQNKKYKIMKDRIESDETPFDQEIIRETHHRVKNNLQMIASILSLQSRRSESSIVKQVLKENVARIQSVACIHDMIIRSKSLQTISLMTLLKKLSHNIQILVPQDKNIVLEIAGDDISLGKDQDIAIVLAVNELIINSLKHAFTGDKQGIITVRAIKGTLQHTIKIVDNGVGYDSQNKNTDSLGLNIVKMSVHEKLGGHLQIYSDHNGTTATIIFPAIL